jgi:hypothetical protein
MKSVGTETPPGTEHDDDETTRQSLIAKAFRQMASWEDVNDQPQAACAEATDSQAGLRELLAMLAEKADDIKNLPNGVYSGFNIPSESPFPGPGLVALLGHPAKPAGRQWHEYATRKLVYLDEQGGQILPEGTDVLRLLAAHRMSDRHVPPEVDAHEAKILDDYKERIHTCITTAPAGMEVFNHAGAGHADTITDPAHWDLVAWMVVSGNGQETG